MRRRTLLAGLCALSTGCLSAPSARPRTAGGTGPASGTSRTSCRSDERTERTDDEDETGTEYRVTNLTVSTETARPGVRYVLEPSAFFSAAAVDREEERTGERLVVRDVSDVRDEAIREALATAARTGEWRSDAVPDGLAPLVERVDFFTGLSSDDTYTHIGFALHRSHPDRPPAVEFDATVVDGAVSAESPGVIELSLTNTGRERQEVFAGTVPPFGAVFATASFGTDRFLLWRDYGEGCISFTDRGVVQCSIGRMVTLRPCQSVRRRYRVLPGTTANHPELTVPPGPGTYRIADDVSYSRGSGAPESTLSFEATFSLERP